MLSYNWKNSVKFIFTYTQTQKRERKREKDSEKKRKNWQQSVEVQALRKGFSVGVR
jgi:hypothetical protein